MTFEKHVKRASVRKSLSALITIAPAYVVAILFPNAFIKILGFAGAIVATIGILIPTYLIFKIGIEKVTYYRELKKGPLIACIIGGLCIVLVEFFMNN